MSDRHTTNWKLPQATSSTRTVGWPMPGSTPVRVLTPDEHDRLLAVVRAAIQAGAWPIVIYDDVFGNCCIHCNACAGSLHIDGAVEHDPECAGVLLADALAALEANE